MVTATRRWRGDAKRCQTLRQGVDATLAVLSAFVFARLASIPRATSKVAGIRRGFRNWPGLTSAIALSKLGLGPRDLVAITRAGSSISCPNVGTSRMVLLEIHVDDEYGLAHVELPTGSRRPVVIDIGAHVGMFMLDVCERFPQAQVSCFEPSPSSFGYLARNIQNNQLGNRVKATNQAVSDHDGTLELFLDRASTGNTAYPELHSWAQEPTTVPCRAFDAVVSDAGGEVDLVKIDCEGGEFDIILESSDAAWQGVSRVVVEHHAVRGHGWPEIESRLNSLGFGVREHRLHHQGWGVAHLARAS